MNPREKKQRVFGLNKKLAIYGARKQEQAALEVFRTFEMENLTPSAHTLTTMVNLYARLGKIAEAWRFFDMFDVNKKSGEQSDKSGQIAAFTALLKGVWVESYDKKQTRVLLQKLVQGEDNSGTSIIPNERTMNTLYRGCLRWGELDLALDWYFNKRMTDDVWWLDPAALEYLIKITTQALLLKTAKKILKEQGKLWILRKRRSHSDNDRGGDDDINNCNGTQDVEAADVSILLSFAKARLILRQLKKTRSMLTCAKTGLSGLDERQNGSSFPNSTNSTSGAGVAYVGATGKKRKAPPDAVENKGPIAPGDVENHSHASSSSSSYLTFEKHRLGDLKLEAEHLWKALEKAEKSAECSAERGSKGRSGLDKMARMFSRFHYYNSNSTTNDPRNLKTIGYRGEIPQDLQKSLVNKAQKGAARSYFINDDVKSQKRLILELGSGNGEWMIASADKANRDKSSTVFFASELRHDRCVKIWCQAVFQELDNIYVLGGDARDVVGSGIQNSSLDLVITNFPEPPTWHQEQKTSSKSYSDHLSETQHLLTKSFMNEVVHAKLKKGGEFLVFTDNQFYGEWVAANLENGTTWEGTPATLEKGRPKECEGIKTYFDRLWAQGKKKARYFVRVRKR